MNSCAIYCTSRLPVNFHNCATKDMQKKNISPPPPQLIDLALAQLHLELAEPRPGAALQCTVHYSTVHDSDEQLRHLLYFKTSSQLHNCATKDDHVCKCKKHDVA